MCGGCLYWHPMKYQLVLQPGCSGSVASQHYMSGAPCMKGSDLKWRQDMLGRGHALDVDHSCEHSVHGVTCCYAGGKHFTQSWMCWVSDATGDSIWQDGQDQQSVCTVGSETETQHCQWCSDRISYCQVRTIIQTRTAVMWVCLLSE